MFFGATKNREDNLETFFGTVSKHRKVIIEGSSGIMNFDMGPMGKNSKIRPLTWATGKFAILDFRMFLFKDRLKKVVCFP